MDIGPWTFDSAAQRLQCKGRMIRLEHRAARLLALLAARSGEVVSREDIVQAIWNGRSLSDNSVAVVVSDLRRALGDDARAPSFIETVPKRGYRMPTELVRHCRPLPDPPARAASKRGRLVIALLAMLVLVFIAAAVGGIRPFWSEPAGLAIITINDVRNETGSESYEPLASAVTAIGTAYLTSAAAPILVRDRWDFDADDPSRGLYEDFGAHAEVHHISSTIVMEGESLRLVMVATDPRTNRVIWSSDATLSGRNTRSVVRTALQDFLRHTGLQQN